MNAVHHRRAGKEEEEEEDTWLVRDRDGDGVGWNPTLALSQHCLAGVLVSTGGNAGNCCPPPGSPMPRSVNPKSVNTHANTASPGHQKLLASPSTPSFVTALSTTRRRTAKTARQQGALPTFNQRSRRLLLAEVAKLASQGSYLHGSSADLLDFLTGPLEVLLCAIWQEGRASWGVSL